MGTFHGLQTKHKHLWEDEVAGFKFFLLVINGIRVYHATDPSIVAVFHVIVVHLLLTDKEIDDLRNRASTKRSSKGPGGTMDTSPGS